MEILLMSMGTRGDMEPFLAIGHLLKEKGHDVTAVMPIQFEQEVLDTHLNFIPFDKRFLEMLESEEAKSFLGQKGNILTRLGILRKMYLQMKAVHHIFIKEQYETLRDEQPDIVIFHAKIYMAYIWGMQNKGKAYFLFPMPQLMHPNEHVPSIPLTKNMGKFLNLLTFRLLNFFTAKYMIKFTKKFHKYYPGLKMTNKRVRNFMLDEARSMIMISRYMYNRPPDWKENVRILGFRERNKKVNWEADDQLLDFIRRYPKYCLITFGSMVNAEPQKNTAFILDILERYKIPAIINTYAGGLEEQKDAGEHILFVNRIPYDYIFPKCYLVMHHGGAGTTHMAIKYQCVNVVVPHAVDQFYWNKNVASLGVGPLGVPIKKLRTKQFENLFLDAWENISYKRKVEHLGKLMEQENHEKEILSFLNLD